VIDLRKVGSSSQDNFFADSKMTCMKTIFSVCSCDDN